MTSLRQRMIDDMQARNLSPGGNWGVETGWGKLGQLGGKLVENWVGKLAENWYGKLVPENWKTGKLVQPELAPISNTKRGQSNRSSINPAKSQQKSKLSAH